MGVHMGTGSDRVFLANPAPNPFYIWEEGAIGWHERTMTENQEPVFLPQDIFLHLINITKGSWVCIGLWVLCK